MPIYCRLLELVLIQMVSILNNQKSIFHWSGGKDCALALYKLHQNPAFDIQELWTSLSQEYKRVSMHGVSENLLDKQALALGLPLKKIFLKEGIKMEDYNSTMSENYQTAKDKGQLHHIFGDIFLEDLKNYREGQLGKKGLKGVYPLWNLNSHRLVSEFIELGFKAVVVCIDSRKLDKGFLGRNLDQQFLADLPKEVDCCGENGEFHSFVYDGPIFKNPIDFKIGQSVFKEYSLALESKNDCFKEPEMGKAGFWFCDLEES